MITISYPGVYVTELASDVHAIDGVSTCAPEAPDWTQHNDHDPGQTLLELFALTTESLRFRAAQIPERGGTAGHVERAQVASTCEKPIPGPVVAAVDQDALFTFAVICGRCL